MLALILAGPLAAEAPKVHEVTGEALLRTGDGVALDTGVGIAKTPPRVTVMLYPGQTYDGNPWSVWGDGVYHDGIYYSAIGDHLAPVGNAFVHAYDPEKKELRQLLDLRSILKRPEGWYTPGKIHSSLGFGQDGWLYFSTHRGGTRATTKENHFEGAWILRHHPGEAKTEIVATSPLPMETLPTGIVDGERMLFYGGSAKGDHRDKGVSFLVYDLATREIVHRDDEGPKRAMILTKAGKVYYHPWNRAGEGDAAPKLRVFDPVVGKPAETEAALRMRAATRETRDGKVCTVDRDGIWSFDVATEKTEFLGKAAVGGEAYITSIDADPTGRYLYYVPGAHGGGWRDGTPVVRFDVETRTRHVVAFLARAVHEATAYLPMGSYATALSDDGKRLFVTFNGNQGTADPWAGKKVRFDTCGLVVVDLPE